MKFQSFIKTAFIFLTGNVLTKLVSFFLLPIYTSKISPDQFGNYDVVMSIINLVAPIAFFQIWDGMYRYAFDYDNERDKKNIISNSIVVCLFSCFIYLILFNFIEKIFKFQYLVYVVIYGLLYAVQYLYTYTARIFLENKLFVFSGVFATITTALLNILLIVGFNWDIKSIYLSASIGIIVQLIIIELKIGVLRHFSITKTNYALIKKMTIFSFPLCIATISYWLLSGYTRVLIMNFCGDSVNGIYAIANKFASMITLVVTVLQYAWNETAYLMANDNELKKNYSMSIDIMITGIAYGVAFFSLVTKIIFPYVINVQYSEAIYLVPIVVIGVGGNSLAGFLGTVFMTEKKTNFILISTLIASVVNIIIGYFATKYYGVYGAAIALTVSFIILMLLRLIKLKKRYDIELNSRKVATIVSAMAISTLAVFILDSNIEIMGILLIIMFMFVLSINKYIKYFTMATKRS